MKILKNKNQRYYLPKGIIKNFNVIINGKSFFDQPINFDAKQFQEITKLTTGKRDDYTTSCLIDYDCIKNHYRLKADDLNGKKELDADPKAIQLIEFVGKLKKQDANYYVADAVGDDKFIFCLKN